MLSIGNLLVGGVLALVASILLPAVSRAQDSCPDTLAWTRTLAVKLGQSRSQAEIDWAQATVRVQQLEAEVQRLREMLKQAEERAKPAAEGGR